MDGGGKSQFTIRLSMSKLFTKMFDFQIYSSLFSFYCPISPFSNQYCIEIDIRMFHEFIEQGW